MKGYQEGFAKPEPGMASNLLVFLRCENINPATG